VRVEKVPAEDAGESAPHFSVLRHPASLPKPPDILRYGWVKR
jgi:hypothetical protein